MTVDSLNIFLLLILAKKVQNYMACGDVHMYNPKNRDISYVTFVRLMVAQSSREVTTFCH